jgi:hypothetical protein
MFSSIYHRTRLKIRGLNFRERSAKDIPQSSLDRIDILWAAAMGLGPVDLIRGADFQARQMILALDAGEPFRIARGLAHETIFVSHRGNRSEEAIQRVQALTMATAEKIAQPNPQGRAYIAAGIAALMQGRWKESTALLEKAEFILREHCTGMDYELHIAQHQLLIGYYVLGNLRELERRLPALLHEAKEKGDLMASTNLMTSLSFILHLAKDDPGEARRDLKKSMDAWSRRGFHTQHYNELVSLGNIELYASNPHAAWQLLKERWAALQGSLLMKVQPIAITCWELRARSALAVARHTQDPLQRKALLKQARADRVKIDKENTSYGKALALRLQAMEALLNESKTEGTALLLQAEAIFANCDMALHAAAARYARATLQQPGDSDLLRGATVEMQHKGIADPARFAAMHLPI